MGINVYRSKRKSMLIIDMVAMGVSFVIFLTIRNHIMQDNLGNIYSLSLYTFFLIENIILCSLGELFYRAYCLKKTEGTLRDDKFIEDETTKISIEETYRDGIRHVYIIGSKSIGQYGGYESFVMNLLKQHENNKSIKYHVACKANGSGHMNLARLQGATKINNYEFSYCNAHCFFIKVPKRLGAAQAIFYDIKALNWCCEHIKKNHIKHPIVYILASRIGPFEKKYVDRIHDAHGLVYQNPDGHEDWRTKWTPMIRRYWKFSERMAVKRADLVVCDSKSIENYINAEYNQYNLKTTFIAYGSYVKASTLTDDNPKYLNWLSEHNLKDHQFYTIVGRCVPENNFETIIQEFMVSSSKRDLAIITTDNPKFLKLMNRKLHYMHDKRIKFVGTVYDQELLAKIRENAYGYFHGHSVGGTNPSLLEALGATNLNLLYDVEFNREVAEDAALYWSLDENNLAGLINTVDNFSEEKIKELGTKAKERIRQEYSWKLIAGKYDKIFRISES